MQYRDLYIGLVRGHLGRSPKRDEGETAAAVARCERRLSFTLPCAVRAYYRVAGRLDALNAAHNRLVPLADLRIDGRHLWFMEENQAVVHWGLSTKQLHEPDPKVYQRANVDGAKWYSERMRFSAFLKHVFDWQAGLGAGAE